MPSELLELPQPVDSSSDPLASILIVDDDRAMVEVLAWRLRRQGYLVRTAASGREGLALALEAPPAVILLDLRLPDVDGFTVCQQLADAPKTCGTPVIVVSGMEGPDIIRRCRAAGSEYFLRKPYDPNVLLVLIRQALATLHE